MMVVEVPLVRWRASLPARVVCWFMALALAGVWLYAGPGFETMWDVAWNVVVLAGIASCVLMVTGHIDLYADRVVIDGTFRRHREIQLTQLQVVEPSEYGLFFRTGPTEGVYGPVSIGAKGLALELLGVRNRGDRIAEKVMAQANADKAS